MKTSCLTLLALGILAARSPAVEPVFLARTVAGKELRGPLHALASDWSVALGKGGRRKVAGADLLCLRREGAVLPPLPSGEHLILANGDRIPVQDLRLDDEKLVFRHKDLGDGKEVSLPLSAVVLIWRMAPDRVVTPERFRRQIVQDKRSLDRVLLRNGDALEGTVNALGAGNVEVEVNKKTVTTRWPQVAVVAMSTELTDRLPLKGVHARLILAASDGSPGGRVTLTSATSDGSVLRGKTAFGATVNVPIGRIVALEILGGKAIDLSDLEARYEYRPYLDEKWAFTTGGNVLGRDLRLGGSTYDRGVSMHAHSLLTYSLGGAYRRFEAKVGLDDRDGRKGRVRVGVLVDGKAADLGKKDVLTHAGGPLPVNIDVTGAKTLTLEVLNTADGPVQGVVDWVEARLIRSDGLSR